VLYPKSLAPRRRAKNALHYAACGITGAAATRLCHLAGGELDQIQFLLGHVSIQTTERYVGCKQKLRFAVNDGMGVEPDNPPASQ
jgi:hypothetical protein